ncbi:hypothetical protein D3C86_1487000 [compost metagenome]
MVGGFVEYQTFGVGKEGAYQRHAGKFATAQRSRQPLRAQVCQSAVRQRLLQARSDIPPSIQQVEVSGVRRPAFHSRQRIEYRCQSGDVCNRRPFCGDDFLGHVGDRATTRDLSILRFEQANQRSRQHTLARAISTQQPGTLALECFTQVVQQRPAIRQRHRDMPHGD